MKKLIKLIFVSHIVILFLLVPVLSFTQDMDSLWNCYAMYERLSRQLSYVREVS